MSTKTPRVVRGVQPPRLQDDVTLVVRGGGSAANDAVPKPGRGDTLGRYMVLDKLGEGGMGVVYAAYDPELERKVAVKVLRDQQLGDQERNADRARLLREAQALAKLSHPNVLPVFDVGTVGGQVFITTEYVAGCTLSAWLRQKHRTWREVVRGFVAAGRGLAAAHAAGLVHRDFKPSNVMVGDDGTVRVMDFGLARRCGDASLDDSPARTGTMEGDDTGRSETTDSLTRADEVMGTPRYMAPEQHLGREVRASADQYAFCVALYHALYGQPPFPETQGQDLLVAKEQLRLIPVNDGRGVPRRLRRLVLRGLQPDPTHRFASMDALLLELERDPGGRGIRVAVASCVMATALVGGWGYGQAEEREQALCSGASAKLAGIWDGPTQTRLGEAFAAIEKHYAEETWERVRTAIDGYARAWTKAHEEACRDTHVQHHQSEAILDLRMACLDNRLRDLEALTVVFADADEPVVQKAVGAVDRLPPIEQCGQLDRLQDEVPPPAEHQREQVESMRREFSAIKALGGTGRFVEALPRAEEVLERARALGYGPLTAEALYRLGGQQAAAGHYDKALEALSEASWLAEALRMDELTGQAQAYVVRILGTDLRQLDEALQWSKHARASVARLPSSDGLEADLLSALGATYQTHWMLEDARDHHERALEVHRRVSGVDDLDAAAHYGNLGIVAAQQRRFEDAAGYYRKTYDIAAAQLGPNHPMVGVSLLNMGSTDYLAGEYLRAREYFERSLSVLEPALGAEHPSVGTAYACLATALFAIDDLEGAAKLYRRAIDILKGSLGPAYVSANESAYRLIQVQAELGDLGGAEQVLDETRAVVEEHFPKDPVVVARLAEAAGTLEIAQGRHLRAATTFRHGLEALTAAQGSNEDLIARLRLGFGRALRADGRAEGAVEVLEPALSWGAKITRHTLGDLHFEFAQALMGARGDLQRAHEHARQAIDVYSALGQPYQDERDAVLEWMRAHLEPR